MLKVIIFITLFYIFPTQASPAAETTVPSAEDLKTYLAVTPEDIVLGNNTAPVTVVEYSSLSCVHCGAFNKNSFPQIQKKFIDTGKIKYVHRHYPIDASSLKAAMLVSCQPGEQYHKLLGILFATQDSWAYDKNFLVLLENIAAISGIDRAQAQKCMNDPIIETKLLTSRLMAQQHLKVMGTPSFFINNQPYNHSVPLEQAIDDVLLKVAK